MTDANAVIEQRKGFSCLAGVSKTEIDQAEVELGLKFAKDYRAYLMKFGTASYYGHELTGLDGPDWVNVVSVTQEARKTNPNVPKNYYVIEEMHIDGVVFWQNEVGEVYESIPLTSPVKRFDCLVQYVEQTTLDEVDD